MLSDISFSEAMRILCVKPHTLRYWLKRLAVVSAVKDSAGRIRLSMRDLQILLRARFLIVDSMMSVKAASRTLLDELAAGKTPSLLNGMKTQIIESMIKKMREQ